MTSRSRQHGPHKNDPNLYTMTGWQIVEDADFVAKAGSERRPSQYTRDDCMWMKKIVEMNADGDEDGAKKLYDEKKSDFHFPYSFDALVRNATVDPDPESPSGLYWKEDPMLPFDLIPQKVKIHADSKRNKNVSLRELRDEKVMKFNGRPWFFNYDTLDLLVDKPPAPAPAPRPQTVTEDDDEDEEEVPELSASELESAASGGGAMVRRVKNNRVVVTRAPMQDPSELIHSTASGLMAGVGIPPGVAPKFEVHMTVVHGDSTSNTNHFQGDQHIHSGAGGASSDGEKPLTAKEMKEMLEEHDQKQEARNEENKRTQKAYFDKQDANHVKTRTENSRQFQDLSNQNERIISQTSVKKPRRQDVKFSTPGPRSVAQRLTFDDAEFEATSPSPPLDHIENYRGDGKELLGSGLQAVFAMIDELKSLTREDLAQALRDSKVSRATFDSVVWARSDYSPTVNDCDLPVYLFESIESMKRYVTGAPHGLIPPKSVVVLRRPVDEDEAGADGAKVLKSNDVFVCVVFDELNPHNVVQERVSKGVLACLGCTSNFRVSIPIADMVEEDGTALMTIEFSIHAKNDEAARSVIQLLDDSIKKSDAKVVEESKMVLDETYLQKGLSRAEAELEAGELQHMQQEDFVLQARYARDNEKDFTNADIPAALVFRHTEEMSRYLHHRLPHDWCVDNRNRAVVLVYGEPGGEVHLYKVDSEIDEDCKTPDDVLASMPGAMGKVRGGALQFRYNHKGRQAEEVHYILADEDEQCRSLLSLLAASASKVPDMNVSLEGFNTDSTDKSNLAIQKSSFLALLKNSSVTFESILVAEGTQQQLRLAHHKITLKDCVLWKRGAPLLVENSVYASPTRLNLTLKGKLYLENVVVAVGKGHISELHLEGTISTEKELDALKAICDTAKGVFPDGRDCKVTMKLDAAKTLEIGGEKTRTLGDGDIRKFAIGEKIKADLLAQTISVNPETAAPETAPPPAATPAGTSPPPAIPQPPPAAPADVSAAAVLPAGKPAEKATPTILPPRQAAPAADKPAGTPAAAPPAAAIATDAPTTAAAPVAADGSYFSPTRGFVFGGGATAATIGGSTSGFGFRLGGNAGTATLEQKSATASAFVDKKDNKTNPKAPAFSTGPGGIEKVGGVGTSKATTSATTGIVGKPKEDSADGNKDAPTSASKASGGPPVAGDNKEGAVGVNMKPNDSVTMKNDSEAGGAGSSVQTAPTTARGAGGTTKNPVPPRPPAASAATVLKVGVIVECLTMGSKRARVTKEGTGAGEDKFWLVEFLDGSSRRGLKYKAKNLKVVSKGGNTSG